MDKITPTLWKVRRPPEAEDWSPRGRTAGRQQATSSGASAPILTSCLQTGPEEEALRYILFLSLEQQFGARSCLVFLISPKSLWTGRICSPGSGLRVTGEQPNSNILSEVSFFLSCQNKTKNSKSYTSYKNKRPKILSNLHFWDFPSKKKKKNKPKGKTKAFFGWFLSLSHP